MRQTLTPEDSRETRPPTFLLTIVVITSIVGSCNEPPKPKRKLHRPAWKPGLRQPAAHRRRPRPRRRGPAQALRPFRHAVQHPAHPARRRRERPGLPRGRLPAHLARSGHHPPAGPHGIPRTDRPRARSAGPPRGEDPHHRGRAAGAGRTGSARARTCIAASCATFPRSNSGNCRTCWTAPASAWKRRSSPIDFFEAARNSSSRKYEIKEKRT